jgi:hypothetical protein
VPAIIEVRASVPADSSSAVDYLDVHRLACYLLEPPEARSHRLQDKPFSVWPPLSVADQPLVEDSSPGFDLISLRFNWLATTPPPVDEVQDRLQRTPHLGTHVPLTPLGLEVQELTYGDLCAGTPQMVCDVEFHSPTHFSRNGRRYPLPDPMVVMSGLARRWNVSAGAADPALVIPRPAIDSLVAHSVIEACAIHTEVTISPVRQVGFVGKARFALTPSAKQADAALFAGLWRFAALAGIGRGTTYGLGAIEVTFP